MAAPTIIECVLADLRVGQCAEVDIRTPKGILLAAIRVEYTGLGGYRARTYAADLVTELRPFSFEATGLKVAEVCLKAMSDLLMEMLTAESRKRWDEALTPETKG